MTTSSFTILSFIGLTLAACGPEPGGTDTGTSGSSTSTSDGPVTVTEPPDTTTTTTTTTTTGDDCQSGTCGSSTAPTTTTTGHEHDTCGTGCHEEEPNTEDVEPPKCAPGAGDLSPVWAQTDAQSERGEAVATGAGRVAWVTGGISNESRLRVLDPDGALLWEQSMTLLAGETEATFKDLAIGPEGDVVVAGTTPDMDGLVRWFADDGTPLNEELFVGAGFDQWAGVVRLAGGDIVVAGATDDGGTDQMFLRRYAADGTPMWSQSFSDQGAAWSSDVAVRGDMVLISGHSNKNPGPVLLMYDPNGKLIWSIIEPPSQSLQVAWSVAASSGGQFVLAISHADGTGRLDSYNTLGMPQASVPLDFAPRSIAVDADDNLVVAGTVFQTKTAVVERRSVDGDLLARHERPDGQALAVAVDAECHTYFTGVDVDIAWLDKLN